MAVVLALAAWGCSEASQARKCEPTTGKGCESGERCVVAQSGAPDCVTGGLDLAEGDRCTGPTDCAAGMGCISAFGTSRCLRFCVPAVDTNEDPCRAETALVDPEALHRFADFGRCLASLPDRPDIGVCVLPCEPGGDDPECLSCGLVLGLGMATCVAPGEAAEGEGCGVAAACDVDLFCEPNTATCRAPAVEAGCAAGSPQVIPGVRDPLTFRDYEVCVP